MGYWLLSIFFLLCSFSTQAADDPLSLRQKILMPGPLSKVHQKYETECSNCHVSFEKHNLTKQCLDCHEDIDKDRKTKSGFHGQNQFAVTTNCETCHTDHEGREFDITGLQVDRFDHNDTGFPLDGAHHTLTCASCHQPGTPFRDTQNQCESCHKEQDVHRGQLGGKCETCHNTSRWQDHEPFDHSDTAFPLEGAHKQAACGSCHLGDQYTIEQRTCIDCHRAADIHLGANGTQCHDCHGSDSWSTIKFDHNETQFPLKGAHAQQACQSCHSPGSDPAKTPTSCDSCHGDDDIHLGRNGNQCQHCHLSTEWKRTTFNHDQDTDFPLTNKHRDLSCTQCHKGKLDETLPRDCAGCHKADDVHNSSNMRLCGTCHSTKGWRSTNLFDHDFTAFPLIGMHQVSPCESCHIGNQFTGIPSKCIDCHSNDDKHKGALGANCSQCHTPNDWRIWQFDHNTQTAFELHGKHHNLACEACHSPNSDPGQTSSVCGSCHHAQDIHKGEFGLQCGRCHSENNFFELMFQ